MTGVRCGVLSWFCLAIAAVAPAQEERGGGEYELLLQEGQRKLLRGELSAAQASFDELLEILAEDGVPAGNPIRSAAEAGICTIDVRRGRYEEVQRTIERAGAAEPTRAVLLVHAEALRRTGRYEIAARLLGGLVARDPGDFEAKHELGEVLWADGQRRRARQLWQENADREPPKDGLQLAFQGRSLFRLGGRANLELASRRLVDAMTAAPERPEARTTLGELKFVAYGETAGFPSGEKDLAKVLEQNGDDEEALLAMYRLRSANMALDASKTEGFLTRVLERNPRCVEALVLRAANVLDDRAYDEAARMLDAALAIDPNDRGALCHRAAASWLLHADADYQRFRERALAGDPGWPEPDRVLADHLVALYRFADALPFYDAALAVAPDDVPSLHGMAKALVYTGEGERARTLLERAKALEPGFVDAWRNNAIAVQDLLDSEYVVAAQDGFQLRLHKDDAEVLRTYLLPIQLEAADVLGAKYGWRPDANTTVEVMHTWDDFSVRTIGFRGFTALGACFGRLITLVSPVDADLRKQDFMWEATAWHEYTHVLTLGLSKHRVPRWLTEGFSVYEERARDPSWERGMDRELFDAFHNGDIPPVHLLNRLFRGPRILFGYYQGGLIVELIQRRYGFDKALELLRAFGDDLGTEAAFQRALGIGSRDFDREFLEFVEQKLRGMRLVPHSDERTMGRLELAARQDPAALAARVELAWGAMHRNNPVDAGRWLAEVLRADPANAAGLLVRAEMFRRRGENDAAVDCWRRGFAGGSDDFDSRIRFGDTLLALGDPAGAIDQWQRAKACWPSCTEQETAPELRLAKLYRDQGDRTQAQMEMKAFCRRTARAFAPRYTLAEFERESGNRREELRLLLECNRIDPFHRELHVRLGDAYEAVEQPAQAALEYEVAAAVSPAQDRRYLARDATAPEPDGPDERAERGSLWVRAAELRNRIGDRERAEQLLARAVEQAAGTDAAERAAALQREWRGR